MNFHRSFLFFSNATVLWAFLILVFFVELHPAAIATFLLLYFLGIMRERLGLRVSAAFWLIASLTCLVAGLYGWFILNERLYSVVYLFLYLEINKLWTGGRTRDHLHLYGLTFFQVLAASVSTASLLFAPALCLYMFLMLGALITVTMKKDAEIALGSRRTMPRGNDPPYERLDDHERRRLKDFLARSYLTRRTAVGLIVRLFFILAVGLGLFFIVPRLQAQSFLRGLSSPGNPDTLVSGFTDVVEFSATEEIQTDPTILMRAFPTSGYEYFAGEPAIGVMRLRGTSLNHYDGRRWNKRSSDPNAVTDRERRRAVFFDQRPTENISGVYRRTTITLEPNRSSYIFGPDRAAAFEFETSTEVKIDRESESVQIVQGNWNFPLKYNVLSVSLDDPGIIPERDLIDRRRLRTVEGAVGVLREGIRNILLPKQDDDLENSYLQLPDHPDMETVRTLATEWTEGLSDPQEIIETIERRLQRDYEYSLKIAFASAPDHLTQFLMQERQGHCEYFATAMILMLRSLGIPARLVNGYASDEWVSSGGGYYLVRQEHAHSWVEAWMPGKGWITYDPTPSSGIGSSRLQSTLYRTVTRWLDTLKLFWYDNIIDYDERDQGFLYGLIFRSIDIIPDTQAWLQQFLAGRGGPMETRRTLLIVGLGVVLGVISLLLIREGLRMRRLARKGSTAARASAARTESVKEYLRLLGELEKRMNRPTAQTPLEYARTVVLKDGQLDEFLPLTRKYYDVRFNGSLWEASDTARASALLRLVTSERKPVTQG